MANSWRAAALGRPLAPVYDPTTHSWIQAAEAPAMGTSWLEGGLLSQGDIANHFRQTGTLISPSAPGWVMEDEQARYWDELRDTYIRQTGYEPHWSLSIDELKALIELRAMREAQRRRQLQLEEDRLRGFSQNVLKDPFLARALDDLGLSPEQVYYNPVLRQEVAALAATHRDQARKAYEEGQKTPEARAYARIYGPGQGGRKSGIGGTISY